MRKLLAFSILLLCTSAMGEHLDYFSGRKWIEQECGTNATPQEERLFVGRMVSPRFSSIIRFRKGIRLREIVDQSPLKGKFVLVCVMRPDRLRSGPFTRHAYIRVGPSDIPDYELQRLDVIWLYDDGSTIETGMPNNSVERTAATRLDLIGDRRQTVVVAVASALPAAVAHRCR